MPIDTKEDMQKAVLGTLATGKKNALSGRLIATALGERDTRHIRLAIVELVQHGNPICSSVSPPYGYYLAETPEEIQECLERLRSYLVMIARHYKLLRKAGQPMLNPHQKKMDLETSHDFVQLLNPVSKQWVKIDKTSAKIIDYSDTQFEGIPVAEKAFNPDACVPPAGLTHDNGW